MPKVKSQKKSRRSRQQEVYTVERIVDKRLNDGQVSCCQMSLIFSCCIKEMHVQVEYLLKWIGYPEEENTWEPVNNLDCPDLISNYEKEHNTKLLTAVEPAEAVSKNGVSEESVDIEDIKKNGTDLKVEEEQSEHEDNEPIGFERGLEPEEILGATEQDGQILFLMKW